MRMSGSLKMDDLMGDREEQMVTRSSSEEPSMPHNKPIQQDTPPVSSPPSQKDPEDRVGETQCTLISVPPW